MTDTPIDPKCQEVVELVNEYLGHALTDEDRVAFEKHLHTCPPCTSYLGQMRAVLKLAGSLDRVPPPESVERELLGMFRQWHGKGGR